jgi:hypothetical protein
MIALSQDGTLKHRLQDPPRRQQIIQRPQRPRLDRLGSGLQVSPRGRDHQVAAVRQHQDQLELTPPAHPPHPLKRAALPRMPTPDDPDRRREAIEMGSVSCLPSTEFSTTL